MVGVLGIIVGATGVLGSTQALLMPQTLQMQSEIFEEISQAELEPGGPRLPALPTKFLDYPDWYEGWSLLNGAVGIFLSGGCVLASIFLLILRAGAPRLFLVFSAASVLWHIVRFAVGASVGTFVGWGMIPAAILGIVMHVALIASLLSGDRRAYAHAA